MRLLVLIFLLVSGFSMAMDGNTPPEGVSKEDWEAYLKHKQEWEVMLKARYENELKNSPPVPPWQKFPEQPAGSIFWRMGAGEEYLNDYIGVYFKYSTPEEISAYKSKYPEPTSWAGWYEN